MYDKALIEAGLTEKQAKIYIACLELGSAKTPEIARAAGLKRTTAYGVLDELVSKGLLSVSMKGNSKKYSPEDPQTLLNMMEENKRAVEGVIPQLESIFVTHHMRPRIQFFEGVGGFKRVLEDTLKRKTKKVFQIVKVSEWNKLIGEDYTSEYIQKRSKKNIWAYAIHPKSDDVHDKTYGVESKQWKRHVRYLPPSMFYASTIMIYDDKVAMVSTKRENFGFIITSREFANTFKSYFEFMWSVGSKDPEK